LVSCAIPLYPAPLTRTRFVQSAQQDTGNRIRYKKVDAEPRRVASDDIIKGYQVDKDVYVTVEDAEIESIQSKRPNTIEIDSFVLSRRLTRGTYDSPYYIVPNDKVGEDAFAVIREAMRAKKVVGIGRVVISKRERPDHPWAKRPRALRRHDAALSLRGPGREGYFSEIADVKDRK